MSVRSRRRRLAGALSLAVAGTVATAVAIRAADHRDSTLLTGNPGVDINDVYLFQSPANPGNTVLAMTVSPFVAPPENGTRFFEPDALYQFKIDTDGDAVEDLVIQAVPVYTGARQQLNVVGPARPIRTGSVTRLLSPRRPTDRDPGVPGLEVPVTAAGSARIVTRNGITAFAGLRDDPFFFDLTQFRAVVGGTAAGFRNPGVDAFAGFNTLAIVVEVPSRLLGPQGRPIGVWATTSRLRAAVANPN